MDKPVHPWATSAGEASVLGSEEIKSKFRSFADKDPRVHEEQKGPKTREKEDDPTKPKFERDEAHITKLDRFQKKNLMKVEPKERPNRETINLKPFDVTTIEADYTCVYFGKRRGASEGLIVTSRLSPLVSIAHRGKVFCNAVASVLSARPASTR